MIGIGFPCTGEFSRSGCPCLWSISFRDNSGFFQSGGQLALEWAGHCTFAIFSGVWGCYYATLGQGETAATPMGLLGFSLPVSMAQI